MSGALALKQKTTHNWVSRR